MSSVADLTERQQEVLDFIEKHHREKGFSPSLTEIANALKVSTNTVMVYLKALKQKRLIDYTPGMFRSIALLKNTPPRMAKLNEVADAEAEDINLEDVAAAMMELSVYVQWLQDRVDEKRATPEETIRLPRLTTICRDLLRFVNVFRKIRVELN